MDTDFVIHAVDVRFGDGSAHVVDLCRRVAVMDRVCRAFGYMCMLGRR